MAKLNSAKKLTILIVDDEPILVKGISDFLQAKGFSVSQAQDGEEGIRLAQSVKPDLILMDVMMPKMNGFQALQVLKENTKTMDIPVIMLTVKSAQEDKQEGMQNYAEKYLTKPFDLEVLYTEITNSLRLRRDLPNSA